MQFADIEDAFDTEYSGSSSTWDYETDLYMVYYSLSVFYCSRNQTMLLSYPVFPHIVWKYGG